MGALTMHVTIAGRVQGVGFRYWTAQTAERLGLSGWVRNRRDGTVEAVFSGPREAVEEMLRSCRQGPSYAAVDRVDAQPVDEPPADGFHTRATV